MSERLYKPYRTEARLAINTNKVWYDSCLNYIKESYQLLLDMTSSTQARGLAVFANETHVSWKLGVEGNSTITAPLQNPSRWSGTKFSAKL